MIGFFLAGIAISVAYFIGRGLEACRSARDIAIARSGVQAIDDHRCKLLDDKERLDGVVKALESRLARQTQTTRDAERWLEELGAFATLGLQEIRLKKTA